MNLVNASAFNGPTIPPRHVYLLPPEKVVDPVPPLAGACHEQLRDGFVHQGTTAHTLADNPESADIIIAAIQSTGYGPCFELLRRHEIYRNHAHKLAVYCPDDNQFPALRGLYAAATEQWVKRGWALPAHYISSHIHKFQFSTEEIKDKEILFSFVGSSRTHKVRERITKLHHPRGVIVDSNPASDSTRWWEKPSKHESFATFRDITRRSRFVLCPRGVSSSSIRLFEAMEAGAVPVIVSDSIQLPQGPDWTSFSIRVAERDVESIPAAVEELQNEAASMGRKARDTWEAFFSESATAGTVVRWALQLTPFSRRPISLRAAEYLNPRQIRAKLRYLL
ncbi:MAG TPA: exostosin family protein [Gemmata sp.]|nr:exostosin family protein [Gemmata sp.]